MWRFSPWLDSSLELDALVAACDDDSVLFDSLAVFSDHDNDELLESLREGVLTDTEVALRATVSGGTLLEEDDDEEDEDMMQRTLFRSTSSIGW